MLAWCPLKKHNNNMDEGQGWRDLIGDVIRDKSNRFNEISREIWSNPELPFQEKHAVSVVSKFLLEEGFQVEHEFVTPTGFRAKFGGDGGVNVCFLCEYDAVPGVGHAAGHNLTSEASLAAAVALKECVRNKKLSGRVSSERNFYI